jgi:hypothetical protein
MHILLRRSAATGRSSRHRSFGQALVEFALVFPIFMLIVGAIIQFGLIFWAQNSLNQVIRDAGRWAATQGCAPAGLAAETNAIARSSALFGYVNNQWTGGNYTAHPLKYNVTAGDSPWTGGMAAPRLEAIWFTAEPAVTAGPCPPINNAKVWYIAIRATHSVPIFFPFIPGGGVISTSTQFRMEPAP